MSPDLRFQGYAIHDTAKYTDFELIDFKEKTFGDYDVELKISCCGVCSSDVHTLTGGWGEPILPLISGHEIAGVVTKIGSKVSEFKVGDRAGVGAQVFSCFKCNSCKNDLENYCEEGGVDTYNGRYPNGDIAQGGYSSGIRVHERFVFALPDALKDEDAASMLCGGLTVYAPLEFYGTGPGKKVGVAGIGGLGHYAIQFATAMGAEVTAFSHQPDKEADAKQMGAKRFILTTGKDFEKEHAFEFDLIICTIDDAEGLPLTSFLSMLKVHGRFHQVGLPDKPLPQFQGSALAGNGVSLSVSHIGSKKQANAMLKLAAEKGIRTWTEVLPMRDVGKAIEGVKNNTVRYRYLLKNDIE